eukprot:GHVU01064413.1.p1 GENE.GHVU01064413.1~~GHVU01064413.1.p1  ORF type:complete len:144 (-),score=0.28 GHVU01064413.1:495-926(-)
MSMRHEDADRVSGRVSHTHVRRLSVVMGRTRDPHHTHGASTLSGAPMSSTSVYACVPVDMCACADMSACPTSLLLPRYSRVPNWDPIGRTTHDDDAKVVVVHHSIAQRPSAVISPCFPRYVPLVVISPSPSLSPIVAHVDVLE